MTRVPVEVTVDASSCQDIDMLIDSYKKVCTISRFISRHYYRKTSFPIIIQNIWIGLSWLKVGRFVVAVMNL
jgi:hypothetical protein